MLTHGLFKITRNNNDLMKVASMAIDGTAQYKDGIWSNGILSDMEENGFYKSSNTVDDLYFNSLIEIPNAYIDLASIQLNENNTQKPSNTPAPKSSENTLNNYLNNLTLRDSSGNTLTKDTNPFKEKIKKFCENKSGKIEDILNGGIIAEDGKIWLLEVKGDNLNVISLENNNIVRLKESQMYKSLDENSEEKPAIDSVLGLTPTVSITVNGDEIQLDFTNGIMFTLNGDVLTKVSELNNQNNYDYAINNILEEITNK